jgi:hypothetical protein
MLRFIFTLCFALLCAGAARAQDATLAGSITDPPVDPTTGLPSHQGDLGRNTLRVLG